MGGAHLDAAAKFVLERCRPLRRVFGALVALALAVAVFRRVSDVAGTGSAPAGGLIGERVELVLVVMLLMTAAAVGIGSLLGVGGIGSGFGVVGGASGSVHAIRLGFPALGIGVRACANGLTWAAIVMLGVRFTAPAFDPLPGGHEVAAVLLGAGFGAGTARLHRTTAEHEAYRTFNLVAMLLAAGSIASMSLTPTGHWWTRNFSTLGSSGDVAALCFNGAIIVAGLGMSALAPALTAALTHPEFGARRGGVTVMRVLISLVGACLAGVGTVTINTDMALHNVFACGAAAGFASLALGSPWFAKRMPRPLIVLSFVFLVAEVVTFLSYTAIGLFNLTVFEIVAFSLVFAWLIALVALTAGVAHPAPAALEREEWSDATPPRRARRTAAYLVPGRPRGHEWTSARPRGRHPTPIPIPATAMATGVPYARTGW